MEQWLSNTVHYASEKLYSALRVYLLQDSFLYWPYLISTLLIGIGVLYWQKRKHWIDQSPWSHFFNPQIWLHPSAKADYVLYFANALVLPMVFAYFLLRDGVLFQHLIAWTSASPWLQVSAPQWVLNGLFTLAFYIAYDLGRYLAHSLLHESKVLWEIHKVHHSAEVLTVMTSYRAHPLELVIMSGVPAVLTGLVTYVFYKCVGTGFGFYSFMGVHVFLWATNWIDNLRHSNVWLSYGPWLGKWIVSPAHHQLHHSLEDKHMGCNRGYTFAVWDRLFGTLYVPEVKPETYRLGLGNGEEKQFHGLWGMYVLPLILAYKALRPTRTESGAF